MVEIASCQWQTNKLILITHNHFTDAHTHTHTHTHTNTHFFLSHSVFINRLLMFRVWGEKRSLLRFSASPSWNIHTHTHTHTHNTAFALIATAVGWSLGRNASRSKVGCYPRIQLTDLKRWEWHTKFRHMHTHTHTRAHTHTHTHTHTQGVLR